MNHPEALAGEDLPVLKEGWLNKQGGSYKSWKRRYFALNAAQVMYFQTASMKKKVGFILISDITSVTSVSPDPLTKGKGKRDFFFKINVTHSRGFYLIESDTLQESNEWIEAIRSVLTHNSAKISAPSQSTLDLPNRPSFIVGRKNFTPVEEEEDLAGDLVELEDQETEETRKVRSIELYQAINSGNINSAKALLGLRADPKWQNEEEGDRSTLHIAASGANKEICELLLKHSNVPLSRDVRGWDPLHTACYHGNLDYVIAWLDFVLQLQTEDGDYLSPKDKEGRTPLYIAIASGHQNCATALFEVLLSDGDDGAWSEVHHAAVKGDVATLEKELTADAAVASLEGENGLLPLHLACCTAKSSIACVRSLITHGSDPSAGDHFGKTPLHFAATRATPEVLAELLSNSGLQIDPQDSRLKTPLHLAAAQGRVECVSLLLERGAPVSSADESNFLALHHAAAHGRTECVRVLLDKGSKVDACAVEMITALFLAVHGGHSETIKMLAQSGADVNNSPRGTSLLHEAVIRSGSASHAYNVGIVEQLVNLGANVNAADFEGNTPIHLAAHHGCVSACEKLLLKGALVNVVNNEGSTPLRKAVLADMADVITVLLQSGARMDISGGPNKNSPLHDAAELGNIDSVKRLLEKDDAFVDLVDENLKWTPLLRAISMGHVEVADLLISKGASVFHRASKGWTPLHEAALMNRIHCAVLLIENGANVNSRDESGATPLHYASQAGSKECLQILIDRGADLDAKDNVGETPIAKAAQAKQVQCVMMLIIRGAMINSQALSVVQTLLYVLSPSSTLTKNQTSNSNGIESSSDSRVSDFLRRAENELSSGGYQSFVSLLKQWRERRVSLESLSAQVAALFQAENRGNLVHIFNSFLLPQNSFSS